MLHNLWMIGGKETVGQPPDFMSYIIDSKGRGDRGPEVKIAKYGACAASFGTDWIHIFRVAFPGTHKYAPFR